MIEVLEHAEAQGRTDTEKRISSSSLQTGMRNIGELTVKIFCASFHQERQS